MNIGKCQKCGSDDIKAITDRSRTPPRYACMKCGYVWGGLSAWDDKNYFDESQNGNTRPETEYAEPDENLSKDRPHCPKCGSVKIKIIGDRCHDRTPLLRCMECGHHWPKPYADLK